MDWIADPFFQGVLSIISFLFSIITFIISCVITNQINKLKINTVEKAQFSLYRANHIQKLKDYSESIKQADSISMTLCRDMITILTTLQSYTKILSSEDITSISNLLTSQNKIASRATNQWSPNSINEELRIITKTIAILEKGDYII